MTGQYYSSSTNESLFWGILTFLRDAVVGTVSVGLVIGACLFVHFLYRLSRLPKESREYREMSYHLQSETLLRYIITIICLFTLNILFYVFFEMGKTCSYIGVVVWTAYLLFVWGRKKIMQIKK